MLPINLFAKDKGSKYYRVHDKFRCSLMVIRFQVNKTHKLFLVINSSFLLFTLCLIKSSLREICRTPILYEYSNDFLSYADNISSNS